jgi:hypothetical protein
VAKRILVPVVPSERFYEAVVAAADLIASEGGILTFLFTNVRPPPLMEENRESQTESEYTVAPDPADGDELDAWQDQMVRALDDARDLLYERGIEDDQVNYLFADYESPPAQSIADEAAAGAYDLVILSRGYFVNLPDMPGEGPLDLARAVQELEDDGVKLLVT